MMDYFTFRLQDLEEHGIYIYIYIYRQYEDLVWGLFMNKYIFPGADASCSLAWDIEQLERSGFEINKVENCGTHYGLTILTWYKVKKIT